jgi:enoyl-CoA hydratase
VVLAGNHKVFSGGFDLKVFGSGDPQAALDMLKAGFELSHRLLSFRKPVVAAVTGHAIAMGAFLACSVDHRIAAPGYKFHANEVINGMVIPWPGLEILKLRLTRSAYQQAVGLSRVYLTDTALAGGWVDELAMPDLVLERAVEAAKEFAATLNPQAHYGSKIRARKRLSTPCGAASTTCTKNSASDGCPPASPAASRSSPARAHRTGSARRWRVSWFGTAPGWCSARRRSGSTSAPPSWVGTPSAW